MNNVTLLGRIGKDIELKTSKNDKSYATLSIATNDGFGDNQKTNWHNCIAFGKTSEILSQYVHKGDELCVNGSIEYAKKDDKTFTNVIINNFSFVSGGNKSQPTAEKKEPENISNEEPDDLPF